MIQIDLSIQEILAWGLPDEKFNKELTTGFQKLINMSLTDFLQTERDRDNKSLFESLKEIMLHREEQDGVTEMALKIKTHLENFVKLVLYHGR